MELYLNHISDVYVETGNQLLQFPYTFADFGACKGGITFLKPADSILRDVWVIIAPLATCLPQHFSCDLFCWYDERLPLLSVHTGVHCLISERRVFFPLLARCKSCEIVF